MADIGLCRVSTLFPVLFYFSTPGVTTRRRQTHIYFSIFKALLEVIVDCFICNLADQGKIRDADLPLLSAFEDCFFNFRLTTAVRCMLDIGGIFATAGALCHSLPRSSCISSSCVDHERVQVQLGAPPTMVNGEATVLEVSFEVDRQILLFEYFWSLIVWTVWYLRCATLQYCYVIAEPRVR